MLVPSHVCLKVRGIQVRSHSATATAFLPSVTKLVIFSQASVILSTGGGCLVRGCLLWGCAWSGGVGGAWSGGRCLLRGVPSLGGVPGGDPTGQLLLRAVRILLECILVFCVFDALLLKVFTRCGCGLLTFTR